MMAGEKSTLAVAQDTGGDTESRSAAQETESAGKPQSMEIISLDAQGERGDWRASLPDDWTVKVKDEAGVETEVPLRDHPVLAKYGSKDEAVKALVHAQKLIGSKPEGLRVPGENASEAEINDFRKAMGVPDDPGGYEFDVSSVAGWPVDEEGKPVGLRSDLMEGLKETCHKAGFTPQQYQNLLTWYLPLELQERERAREHQASEEAAFKQQYGQQSEQRMRDAAGAAMALGGDALMDVLDKTRAGNYAVVMDAFAKIAPLVREPRSKDGSSANAGESKESLNALMRRPEFYDPSRRDSEIVARVEKGFKQVYGEKPYKGGPVLIKL